MEKIPFYEVRSFGEKFNVVFSFVKQNLKYMIRYILYGVLPLSLLGALSVDNLLAYTMELNEVTANTAFQLFGSYIFLSLVCLLVCLWVGSVVFSCMQIYNERANGLEDITFSEMKPYMKRNAGRIFKCGLVGILVVLVGVAIFVCCALIHGFFGFLVFLCFVALYIPFLLVLPTYIYEDISVWQAYARGFRLGWNTWGGIFALGFVLSLIVNVLSVVFVIPWELCLAFETIFIGSDGSQFGPNIILSVLQYIFGVIMWVGQFTLSILFFVSISYLYSHAAEQQDDMSVAKGIDDFEGMVDDNPDDEDLFKKTEPLV